MTERKWSVIVEPHDLYKYREVFEIIDWECGQIVKTQTTGKFIAAEHVNKLDESFTTTSPSTSLLRSTTPVELQLFNWSR